ncbi:hypothetical protein SOQ34_002524 [Escherichia coli]
MVDSMNSENSSSVNKKHNKPKQVKLRAFKIENNNLTEKSSPAKKLLLQKLVDSSTVKERCMVLNSDDLRQEQDLISFYQTSDNSNSVFCTMVRIAPSEGVEKIPDQLFNKKSFTISDLHNADIDTEVVCKNHFYFCISDNYLVTNLQMNRTISSLQTYIRWLVGNEMIEFTPMIVKGNKVQLKDIKSISVRDPSPLPKEVLVQSSDMKSPPSEIEEKNTKIKLSHAVLNALKSAVPNFPNLKEIIDNQIVSAELLIKFSKPRSMDEDSYAKLLGATLKPVSDLDNIVFKRSDGRSEIKGKELLKIKNVTIEVTDSGKLVEQEVFQEMSRYLKEIENEATNS